MHKIISKKFEIDLSDIDITINEQNSWFSDRFFTKYSYPFSFVATADLNSKLGDVLSYNSLSETSIDCEYVYYNQIEKALLIIENVEGDVVTASLRYGFEDFPNFDKKLSELNLESFSVSNIYSHAEGIITKKYPQTNYNFPQVRTDKFNKEDVQFKFFQDKINNRIDGSFVENSVSSDDEMMNKNIMQPIPYLYYILKQGFASAGYEMLGDIATDSLLKKTLLFCDREYYEHIESEELSLILQTSDTPRWTTIFKGIKDSNWHKSIPITKKGKYNLIGSAMIEGVVLNGRPAGVSIWHNDNLIKEVVVGGEHKVITFDEEIYATNAVDTIRIQLTSVWADEEIMLANIQFLPIYYVDAYGNKIASIINPNKVDLNRSVPDITFGELITTVSNLFNLDLYIEEKKVFLNYINRRFKEGKVHDFRKFEVSNPPFDYKSGIKYLLEYQEDLEDAVLDKMYIDSKGSKSIKAGESIVVDNNIVVNALPLPFETDTVKSVNNGIDKVNLIIYDGLNSGHNTCKPPSELWLENVFKKYHHKWLENRILAKGFRISFHCYIEEILNLKIKDRIFMYNNFHVIESLSKNQISKDLFEIEIETETIKVD